VTGVIRPRCEGNAAPRLGIAASAAVLVERDGVVEPQRPHGHAGGVDGAGELTGGCGGLDLGARAVPRAREGGVAGGGGAGDSLRQTVVPPPGARGQSADEGARRRIFAPAGVAALPRRTGCIAVAAVQLVGVGVRARAAAVGETARALARA